MRESLDRALYTRDRLIRLSPIKLLFPFVPTIIAARIILGIKRVDNVSRQYKDSSNQFPDLKEVTNRNIYITRPLHALYFSNAMLSDLGKPRNCIS